MSNPDIPAHPLFMPDDEDDEAPIVSQLQVVRHENGQRIFVPRLLQAQELVSLEQLAAEFGGGTYELIGRFEGKITTRRKYTIPGKPKPLYNETGSSEEPKAAPTAPAVTVPPVADPLMSMIMMMMQGMMQQQQQAAQSQTQMFIAMMTGNQQNSAEEKAAARAELQANIERERINSERTMQMMREMMASKGGGSGEDFTRGVEFMRGFAVQQVQTLQAQVKGGDSGTDWGSVLETLGQVMQGIGMLKGQGALPEGIGPTEVVEQVAAQ